MGALEILNQFEIQSNVGATSVHHRYILSKLNECEAL